MADDKQVTYKSVHVQWLDACHYSGWHNLEALKDIFEHETPIMSTVGWLLHESDAAVYIAQSMSNVKAGDILRIPRVLIVEIDIDDLD